MSDFSYTVGTQSELDYIQKTLKNLWAEYEKTTCPKLMLDIKDFTQRGFELIERLKDDKKG